MRSKTGTAVAVTTSRDEPNTRSRASSVERAFAMLEDLAMNGSMTRKEILEAASGRRDTIPKATLSDLISMLIHLGYLRYREDTKTYSLGIRLIELGNNAVEALQHAGPQKECRELLIKSVVQKTNVGAHFGILDSGYAVYIMREDAPGFFGPRIKEGKKQVPYLTAIGKALICKFQQTQIAEIVEQHFPHEADDRQTHIESLVRELLKEQLKIRRLGWAIDDEEHALGVVCAAAPIYSASGEVIASIGVSCRSKEFTVDKMNWFGKFILRPAADRAAKSPQIFNVLERHYKMSSSPKASISTRSTRN